MHLKVKRNTLILLYLLKLNEKSFENEKGKKKDVSQLEAESLAKLRQCAVGEGGTQTMGIKMLITNFFFSIMFQKRDF